jgi:hypothetical protein
LCSYDQIIVIANNSGWAGGAPGYYSVVGSGTPATCDPNTCEGAGCPWTLTCSWDYNIAYTALHETGHTFAGLRHTCYPLSPQGKLLQSMEKDVLGAYETQDSQAPAAEDPVNCGVGYTGNPENKCSEWDNPLFINWIDPKDPNFGCYLGCDDNDNWYRPWYTNENTMCIDLSLRNGFTPVDRRLLSNFLGGSAPICLNLDVAVDPAHGSVVVTPSPNCDFGYYPGTSVELVAIPHAGYFFKDWTGDYWDCQNTIRFSINKDTAIAANFTVDEVYCGEKFLPIVGR